MQRLRLSLAALGAAASFSAAAPAAPLTADSKITAATVYAQGAIVTREATVELPAGTQEIVFRDLPGSLDSNLLQVSGGGAAQGTILDVRTASSQLEAPANERLKQLQNELRTLNAELRRVNDRATVLQQQRDFLERIKLASVTPPAAKDSAAALPNVATWQQLVAFYAENLGKTLTEIQELDRQREDVQARLGAVQRQVDELQASAQRAVQHVTVRVEVTTAGAMQLKLAYPVDGAAWTPAYDVRVSSAEKTISLGYGATVRQSSGEDWTGIKLLLSTARPDIAGTPPELTPWRVRETQPADRAFDEYRAREAMAGAGAARMMDAPAAPEADFAYAKAAVETGLTSDTFTIPYAADVPADNEPHKVVITTAPLQSKLTRLTIPKLAELVYLRAAVTNSSEFTLIAGAVNLFVDGNFVAQSHLRTVKPGENFDLDLGVDDGFTVKRKLLNRLTEDTGIILTKRKKLTYDVQITVQNNRKTAETVIVRDQVPISSHEKIFVSYETPGSRDVKKDEEGVLTWTLDLPPGEKRELSLKIAVEHPADLPVTGLE